jgi:hypothetical protein
MGKEYGKAPSEIMQEPIDEFLFNWRCTIELSDVEHDNRENSSHQHPTRYGYDEWKELVELDMEKERKMKIKERKMRHKKN